MQSVSMIWEASGLDPEAVHATWSGVGIIGAAVIGLAFFDESVDIMAITGMALIVAGVIVLNLFSESYAPAH